MEKEWREMHLGSVIICRGFPVCQALSQVLWIQPWKKTQSSSSMAHSHIWSSDEAEKAQRGQTEYPRSHSSGGKKIYTASQASCLILLPATVITPRTLPRSPKHTGLHTVLFISAPCSVALSLLLIDGSGRSGCLPFSHYLPGCLADLIKDDSSICGRV